MRIPDHIIREIKERSQIEDVIGNFVTLKRAGKDLKGECPFCNQKKLTVSPAKQIYKCWSPGCEKGGNDAINFLKDKENLDYLDAIKWLADFYNILILEEHPLQPPLANPKKEDPPAPTGPVTKRSEFFKSTLRSMGLSSDMNQVKIKWLNRASQFETVPILTEDPQGNIEFLVYDINGFVVTHQKQTKDGSRDVPYKVVRLKEPLLNSNDGKMMKYSIPKGVGTKPFFPPALLEKYAEGIPIETLFITEGYKKAISGWINGIDIVGLTSISTYKDKETMQIHRDIIDLILKCKIRNVVLTYDGDCADVSAKAFQEEKDISLRPRNFFASAFRIKELLKDYLKDHEISLYFAHINSESVEGNPKGLDDIYEAMLRVQHKELLKQVPGATNMQAGRLLVEARKLTRQILNTDLYAFSRPGTYFTKINISIAVKKLEQHLALDSATNFYLRHQEIIKDGKFMFFGTQYQYDQEKGECEVIIPAASRNYVRVGDHYYETIGIPDHYNEIELQLHRRDKSTIKDDHGPKFLNHIQKLKAFCNVPDHVTYQPIIKNCYNMYSKFEWEPEEGDCTMTLDFIRHIFEEHYELGLDYLQLLYQRPIQILPILCLVSKENNTGKSTWGKWLKQIFKNNMAIVGNADLANDFNAFWAGKLLICCDEAFIEKKVIIEKIKSLSTATRMTMNQKSRDQVEIHFFGKFMMLTNNEDNFIYATDEDIRYWVRKLKRPKKEVINLERQLVNEIPAFLHYLNNRKMHTSNESRMWFEPTLLRTDALRKVIAGSRPSVEKELRTRLETMFVDFSENIIMMTLTEIRKELLNGKYDDKYVLEVLKDHMKVEQYWEPDPSKPEIKHFKTKRYTFPKWYIDFTNSETKRVDMKGIGRPFVFLRPDFVSPEKEKHLQHDPDFILMAVPVPDHYKRPGMLDFGDKQASAFHGHQEDLPF